MISIIGIIAYFYLINWPDYQIVYNYNLKENNNSGISQEVLITGIDNKTALNETSSITSNKTGYRYLYDAFMQRYKKQLRPPFFIACGVIVLCLLVLTVANIFFVEESLLTYLNMLFWIMYILCEFFGKKFVDICFFQIDRYLINYSFYRTSKAIGENFKLKVVKIIQYTAIPTLLISLIILIQCIFERADWQSYVVGVSLPMILTIFYSIYFVAMYYLFQPYSFSGEKVNKVYSITNGIIYFLVYFIYDADITFSLPVLALMSLCLIIISVILYQITCKKAVKTFRVR